MIPIVLHQVAIRIGTHLIETGQQIRMLEYSLYSLLDQRDMVMRSGVSADSRIPRLQNKLREFGVTHIPTRSKLASRSSNL
jgi:hypothetical protein